MESIGDMSKSVALIIPEIGDMAQCSNYGTIALLSHVGKVLMMVLMVRLKAQLETQLSEKQQR